MRLPATRAARLRCALLLVLGLAMASRAMGEDAQLLPRAREGLLLDIARAGGALLAVGERGHVLRSTDEGRSWAQVPAPTRAMLTALWFVDETHGWAVGHDAVVLFTTDGGRNWLLQRDGLKEQRGLDRAMRDAARERVDALEARRSAEDTPELAGLIDDASRALEDAEAVFEEPVFAPPLFDVWFADRERGFAVGAYGSVLATGDGGAHWSDAREHLADPERHHLYAIAAVEGGSGLLIAGEAGTMFRSADAGAHWEYIDSSHAGTLFGLAAPDNAALVYACGLQGALLRSGDGGRSWEALDAGTRMSLSGMAAGRDGTLWAAGGMGTVLRIDAGGVLALPASQRRAHFSAVIETADGVALAVGQGGAERFAAAGAR